MERISVQELQQHATHDLAQVRAGSRFGVSHRDEVVALLVLPAGAQSGRDRLVTEGLIRPGADGLRLPR